MYLTLPAARRTSQPQGPALVNHKHPLFGGCRALIADAVSSTELNQGIVLGDYNTTISPRVLNRYGVALSSTNGGPCGKTFTGVNPSNALRGYTLFAVGRVFSNGPGATVLATGGSGEGLFVALDGSAKLQTSVAWIANLTSHTGSAMAIGDHFAFAATWENSGVIRYAQLLNGTDYSYSSASSGVTGYTGSASKTGYVLYTGGNAGFDLNFAGFVEGYAAPEVALRDFVYNPWSLFAPDPIRTYFDLSQSAYREAERPKLPVTPLVITPSRVTRQPQTSGVPNRTLVTPSDFLWSAANPFVNAANGAPVTFTSPVSKPFIPTVDGIGYVAADDSYDEGRLTYSSGLVTRGGVTFVTHIRGFAFAGSTLASHGVMRGWNASAGNDTYYVDGNTPAGKLGVSCNGWYGYILTRTGGPIMQQQLVGICVTIRNGRIATFVNGEFWEEVTTTPYVPTYYDTQASDVLLLGSVGSPGWTGFLGSYRDFVVLSRCVDDSTALNLSRATPDFWPLVFAPDPLRVYIDLARAKGTMRPTVMV